MVLSKNKRAKIIRWGTRRTTVTQSRLDLVARDSWMLGNAVPRAPLGFT